MKNKTQIFNSYQDFLARSDKALNGVSKQFAENNPNYEKQNESNYGCFDCSLCFRCFDCSDCSRCSLCSDCSDCSDCSRCSAILENAKYACLVGLYRYVCSPRIHSDGEQWVQMGCHLRTRKDWESDFWNNEIEFPNDGNIKSKRREFAFKIACQWLDFTANNL